MTVVGQGGGESGCEDGGGEDVRVGGGKDGGAGSCNDVSLVLVKMGVKVRVLVRAQ